MWTGPGLALLEAARPTLATALRQILTRGSRGNPCRTDSRLTVLWAGEWRVSDSAPDCWTVARASLSLAGDWQAGLCWGHVCTGPPGWLPCPGPSQLTPTAVGGWRGRDRETAGCGCPPPLCSGRFFPVFTPGTCLWGGLRACRCQGQGAVWCLERLGSSPGHVSSACPRALLTAGTFHVPGAGRPSRVRACSRTAYMGRAAVFMGPGKVCGCLAPGVSGGPGATSCSDLESTFEASGTQRVGQCPQRWRQVAPGGSGRARRGGGQWHPEGRAVPAEVEASGHQRVGQCPQRRLPSGPVTVCLPAQSTRTAWLLRVGPLGACGRTDHKACLWPPGRRCGPGLPRRAAGPQDLVGALFLAGRFCVHDLESQPGTTPGSGARGALSPRPPTAFVRPRGPVAVPGARGQHRPGPSRVLGEGKGPPRGGPWFALDSARSPWTQSGQAPPDKPCRRALPGDRPGQPRGPHRPADAARSARAGW